MSKSVCSALAVSEAPVSNLRFDGENVYLRSTGGRVFDNQTEERRRLELSEGNLLTGGAGQRHGGPLLSLARRLWPRAMIRAWMPRMGLFLVVARRATSLTADGASGSVQQ